MRILIVEDDPHLGDGLRSALRSLGFAPDWLREAAPARHALKHEEYAAVVLDLGLPGEDGVSLLEGLRRQGSKVPVLILTARDAKDDKLSGFAAGADDYVVKPVDVEELAARLHALIRRSAGQAQPRLVCGRVELDPQARRVWRDGEPLDVSAREFAILEKLMTGAGRIVSKAQLEAAIYGWGEGVESNAVEVHIHHLRRKLGHDFIRTLRGIGYLVDSRS
jgi:two-component system, OmpR family, response regulator